MINYNLKSRLDNLWDSVGETAHVISIQKGLINLNDYITKGLYRIIGEVTYPPEETNLPMLNHGGGNTIDAMLWVLDSSLPNVGAKDDDVCVTQFLMLSNRTGGAEGDMFTRSANGKTKDSLTWKRWEKYQTNVEVGQIAESDLDYVIDNGIYSGIIIPNNNSNPGAIETFVMLVINNYAVAGIVKSITQIKFATRADGLYIHTWRQRKTGSNIWSEWLSAVSSDGITDVRLGLIRGNASAGNFTTYTKKEDGSIALGLIYNEIESGKIGVAYTTDVKTYVTNQIKQAITDTLNKEV